MTAEEHRQVRNIIRWNRIMREEQKKEGEQIKKEREKAELESIEF